MSKTLIYLFLIILGIAVLRLFTEHIYMTISDKKKADRIVHYIKLFLFIVYIGCVLYVTIISRSKAYRRPYLDPLWMLRKAIDIQGGTITIRMAYLNGPFENVVLFIPFGFFIPWCYQKLANPLFLTTAMGCIFSMFIEFTQHFAWRGSFETQDILFNTLGTIVGYLVYCLILKNVGDHYENQINGISQTEGGSD